MYYYEEPMDWMATEAEADAEFAQNVGREFPQQAWILSNRDVWYRNPFYTGPAVPHPEDDEYYMHDQDHVAVEPVQAAWQDAIDDEVPF